MHRFLCVRPYACLALDQNSDQKIIHISASIGARLQVYKSLLASCSSQSLWQVCSLQRQVALFVRNLSYNHMNFGWKVLWHPENLQYTLEGCGMPSPKKNYGDFFYDTFFLFQSKCPNQLDGLDLIKYIKAVLLV